MTSGHALTKRQLWPEDVLSTKMKKKENTPTGVKVFAILIIAGVIASIVDGVVYYSYVRSHGVGFFSVVPLSVLWSYVRTFPGNILTALWLAPWAFGFIWLELKGRRS